MTSDEIEAMAKTVNEEIEQMVKQPKEHTPEELIAKAAEARLQIADLTKKEKKRLQALRELSKMSIDDTREFKSAE
jgi:predicted Zn-dependent protease with MMP-like domain